MRQRVYFDVFRGSEWPSPSQLEHYFLSPAGRRQAFGTDNDSWGVSAEGVDGTEQLPRGAGRIDIHLTITACSCTTANGVAHPRRPIGLEATWGGCGNGSKPSMATSCRLGCTFLSKGLGQRSRSSWSGTVRSPRASRGSPTPMFRRTRFPTPICIALRADDGGELQAHGSLCGGPEVRIILARIRNADF